ncbi:MAG TPA: ubiquinol-cytochrome c reductase iron-sulfur subunit [bacterium]
MPDPDLDFASRRRAFLRTTVGALSAAAAATLGLPIVRALFVAPPASGVAWSRVGPVDALGAGSPLEMKFETLGEDAFLRTPELRSVWAVRSGAGNIEVYSPVCPHLGCHYLWNPGSGRFECPCHASVFALDGRVLSGPAPRPLDTLEHRVDAGVLYVRWTQFRAGVARKTAV